MFHFLFANTYLLFAHLYHQPMKEYKLIGTISSTHGLQGWLTAHIQPQFTKYLRKNGFVFIELRNETYIPHRITDIKKESEEFLLIKIKNYNNVEQAKKLTSKGLALPIAELSEKEQMILGVALEGYTLEDTESDFKGTIESITETAGQILAFVSKGEHEVIVPLNQDLIRFVDKKNKLLRMTIPDGLLDIYLR